MTFTAPPSMSQAGGAGPEELPPTASVRPPGHDAEGRAPQGGMDEQSPLSSRVKVWEAGCEVKWVRKAVVIAEEYSIVVSSQGRGYYILWWGRGVMRPVLSVAKMRAGSSILATPRPVTPSDVAASVSAASAGTRPMNAWRRCRWWSSSATGREEVSPAPRRSTVCSRTRETRHPTERLERAVDEIENELRRVPGQRVKHAGRGRARPASAARHRQGGLRAVRVGLPAVRGHRRVPAGAGPPRAHRGRPPAGRAAAAGHRGEASSDTSPA